ncbi:7139_t:CDS:2, partial [Gigaspora margarita]
MVEKGGNFINGKGTRALSSPGAFYKYGIANLLFEESTFGQEFEYTSFENSEKIGQGGFGVIYKAYSKDVNRIVALKTLDHNDKHSLNDFIRE